MFRSRATVAGLLLLALALSAPPPEAGRKARNDARSGPDLTEWIDGPVRYLTIKEEVEQYKALADDPSRALFIERFWARRDPTPETLTNEFRELFWERVRHANGTFIDSPKPGWKTDRGKIYILYGEPTEIQEDLHVATQGLASSGVGIIRWIYEGRPGQRMDLDPVTVVPFVRDASGEFRVSYEPKLSSVFFDPLAIREGRADRYDRYYEMIGAPRRTPLSVMLDLGRMQEVPPQAQVLLEQIETTESYEALDVPVKVEHFVDTERDEPLAVVNIDLAAFGGERPAILARFESDDPEVEQRMLGEDSFKLADAHGRPLAQGRIRLAPGAYDMTVVVAEPIQARTGVHKERIVIPPTSPRMRLSDVVWASELDPVDYASMATHDEPFLVGPFRVVPLIDAAYRRGETINLFFEVYEAVEPLTVRYQLEGRDDDGAWLPLGRPSVDERRGKAQAWGLPTTERWPLGEYRVRIEVQDAEGRAVARYAEFRLVEPEPTP